MKFIASPLLIIIICTLTFLSCSKKKDVNPPARSSVVFWTKNDANLALCRPNNMNIYLTEINPFVGEVLTNTAYIKYTLPSAPTSCGNEATIERLIPGIKYYYRSQNCAIGQWGPRDSFSLSPGECLKIEIP